MDQSLEASQPNNAWKVLLAVVLLILALAFFISRDLEALKLLIIDSGWVGVGFSLSLYAVLGASPIPSEPFTIFLTTVYGPLLVTFLAASGNVLAALMEYYIGTKISDVVRFEKKRAQLPLGLGKMPVNSVLFLVGARMIPGYGPKFVSIVGGMYRVPLLRFTWTAALSNTLGAAIFAYGGYEVLTLIRQAIFY